MAPTVQQGITGDHGNPTQSHSGHLNSDTQSALKCTEELWHETKEDGKVSLLGEQTPLQAAIHLFLHRIVRVLRLHCILCLWQNSSLPISDAPMIEPLHEGFNSLKPSRHQGAQPHCRKLSPFRNRYWYWYFGINIWLTCTDADTVHFLCISVCVCTLQIEPLLYVTFTN